MKKEFHLTQEGHAELVAEQKALLENRGKIAEAISSALSQGDLSENAEYHAAKDEQAKNDNRLEEVERILRSSEIISTPKGTSKVQLGSTVKLKSEDGKTKEFQVVGTVEADPLNGKISDASPIGMALLGKKDGEEVEINTPLETLTYKVVDIS
jgi:transcription elongation factor GreA